MTGHMAAWAFAVLGAAYWSYALWAGITTIRSLVRVVDADPHSGEQVPSVTMIVAARDEQDAFTHEAQALARFDHPALEVVLVDDRSTDRTGALMHAIAAIDPRVRVIHVGELPSGWLGKVHALERGREAATGEWLLFTDADVELASDAIRRAVTFAQAHRLDSMAMLPGVRSDGVLVAGVVAAFSRWLIMGGRLWQTTDPDRPEAFGVGAFNLVRAAALEQAGGFEWLRLDIADDAALANLIAARGGRTMLASGVGLVQVRWQDSVRGMTRGFEKYGGTGGAGSIRAAIVLVSLATLGEIAPWLALVAGVATGTSGAWLVAFGTILLALITGAVLARRAGAPARGGLTGPVGPLLVWWMQVRAAVLEHVRGGLVWRGTFYESQEIRAAKRYHLPGRR